ncbi:hypothetical protein BN1051_01233 [Arthrobacter saudimassiliensis]|uniref:Uncharacterized protein n=1 Tax=Arthrobacter saudimassiliensis TaxID=1461584 RepID=A0A078MR70_9MICC|nr:hypothetical protein BN1051_01233 [Arthrobacter saudimassiliensis]
MNVVLSAVAAIAVVLFCLTLLVLFLLKDRQAQKLQLPGVSVGVDRRKLARLALLAAGLLACVCIGLTLLLNQIVSMLVFGGALMTLLLTIRPIVHATVGSPFILRAPDGSVIELPQPTNQG